MRKIITIFLILVLIFTSPTVISGKTDEEKFKFQEKSILAYEELNKAIEGSIKESDIIGGVFIDDNGYLNIGLVKGSKKPKNIYEKHIKYFWVDRSYNDLYVLIDEIRGQFEQLTVDGVEPQFIYIDNYTNSIVLEVLEYDKAINNLLLKEYSDILTIVKKEDKIINCTDIVNGNQIEVENVTAAGGNGFGTIGFGAKKYLYGYLIEGIVTSGHYSGITTTSDVWINNVKCGNVSAYVNNRYADAAFISLNSSFSATNENTYNREFIGTGPCIVGQFIRMDGQRSGSKFGYINAIGYSNTLQWGLVRATYSSQKGDSGAPVSYYSGGNDILIGMSDSIDANYSYFGDIDDIKSALNLHSIITY